MATVVVASRSAPLLAPTPHRFRKLIGHRRQAEDEADGGADVDDDSATEGSAASDDHHLGAESDTSNIDETSPTNLSVPNKSAFTDTDLMIHGFSLLSGSAAVRDLQELDFADLEATLSASEVEPPPDIAAVNLVAPVIVSSDSARNESFFDRRRREHEEYKKRREEDPAFVPNRGFFFMHDSRSSTGAIARSLPIKGRGRARGVFAAGSLQVMRFSSPLRNTTDPTVSTQWTHDLHQSVAAQLPPRYRSHAYSRPSSQIQSNAPSPSVPVGIPMAPRSLEQINRNMSLHREVGKLNVRVWLPGMHSPRYIPGLIVRQYTRLPDHRPPLRRDKPIRISLPGSPPRLIFPAEDRSFIFIPRAQRPNQQRTSRKPRSGVGSVGGFSRRTSLLGGSHYDGSMYSPSVAMSRRSSITPDPRDLFSPSGSVVSRSGGGLVLPNTTLSRPMPILPMSSTQPDIGGLAIHLPALPPGPVPTAPVALPPGPVATSPATLHNDGCASSPINHGGHVPHQNNTPRSTFSDQYQQIQLEQPPQENRTANVRMHQPRPQKVVSIADIESPTLTQRQSLYQSTVRQSVPNHGPVSESTTYAANRPWYPMQHLTGTPLSQIPERAIYAAPFQPNPNNPYAVAAAEAAAATTQQNYGYSQGFHPYYYQTANSYINPALGLPIGSVPSFGSALQHELQVAPATPTTGPANLVAHQINGMVYYLEPSQIPGAGPYPHPHSYFMQPSYVPPLGMQDMFGFGMIPSAPLQHVPDAYYHPEHAHVASQSHSQNMHSTPHTPSYNQGMVFYSQ